MLDYNIAYDENHQQKLGCLSKSMVLHSENQLTEGIRYLTGFNSKYNPDVDKKMYTFQFINNALIEFELGKYVENIIEIIVLDTVIGNSDRHQENWGVILFYKMAIEDLSNELKRKNIGFLEMISKWFLKIANESTIWRHKNNKKISSITLKLHSEITPHKFSPIYDSGCCLGREFDENKVNKMINDSQMLEAYVKKGESEIHWEGNNKKLKHFELIELLLKNFPNQTSKYILRVKEKYNLEVIKSIIQNVDSNLPSDLINYKLSDSRKIMMYKLITLRIEILLKLI